MSKQNIRVKKSSGRQVLAGDLSLNLVSQSLMIHGPGQTSGLIWNRPIAVGVEIPGQEMQILPIVDHTRRVQILILGIGLLGSALIWLLLRK